MELIVVGEGAPKGRNLATIHRAFDLLCRETGIHHIDETVRIEFLGPLENHPGLPGRDTACVVLGTRHPIEMVVGTQGGMGKKVLSLCHEIIHIKDIIKNIFHNVDGVMWFKGRRISETAHLLYEKFQDPAIAYMLPYEKEAYDRMGKLFLKILQSFPDLASELAGTCEWTVRLMQDPDYFANRCKARMVTLYDTDPLLELLIGDILK